MAFFPQLSTGVAGQFPLRRRQVFRTVRNRMADGREVAYLDAGAQPIELRLELAGLTADEIGALESFYTAQRGQLGRFGFLDPAANLLRWSEDYSRTEWVRGPLLAQTPGAADPWGGTSATILANSAAAPQSMLQTILAPGDYSYCLSLWVLTAAGTPVTLLAASGGFTQSQPAAASGDWQRLSMPVSLPSAEEEIAFGVELPAGATVTVARAQVDAQPAPAGYRRTTTRSGVYPEARFAQDTFSRTARGTNEFSTTVRILARTA